MILYKYSMKKPTFQEEKRLRKKGYKKIAGIDEAGRGPLCGPVVACAVCLDWSKLNPKIDLGQIRDSKQLTAKQRERLYSILTKHSYVELGVGKVSEKVIDRINIYQATRLAMKKAVNNLSKKPDFLILDGNMQIDLDISQKSIIKADEKVFSCSCASIIAKVVRDRIMQRYHKKYPLYGFFQHKGYPTRFHRRMLRKHGPCKLHRTSFRLA